MKQVIKEYHSFLKERFKSDIAVFIVELIFVLFCLGSAIYFLCINKVSNTLMSLVFPLIVLLMCLLEWRLKFRGGALFYVIFFVMCTSNICGNGYGLYQTLFPYFDKVMHTLSGIVFTCLGYTLIKMVTNNDKGKNFAVCLFAGVAFAMAAAAVWEVYEYFVTAVLHDDMQSDYIINSIDFINNISQTIIYYENGEVEVIEGFLDIGLYDTLQDMTVCLLGAVITVVVLIFDNFCTKGKIKEILIPKVLPRANTKLKDMHQEVATV